MTAIEARLLECLKALPPARVDEVIDFVEFLTSREERVAAAKRLGEGLARLDALNLASVTSEEVDAEVQAARKAQRENQGA